MRFPPFSHYTNPMENYLRLTNYKVTFEHISFSIYLHISKALVLWQHMDGCTLNSRPNRTRTFTLMHDQNPKLLQWFRIEWSLCINLKKYSIHKFVWVIIFIFFITMQTILTIKNAVYFEDKTECYLVLSSSKKGKWFTIFKFIITIMLISCIVNKLIAPVIFPCKISLTIFFPCKIRIAENKN